MAYVILQESLGFVGGSLTKLVLETPPFSTSEWPTRYVEFFKIH